MKKIQEQSVEPRKAKEQEMVPLPSLSGMASQNLQTLQETAPSSSAELPGNIMAQATQKRAH